MISPHGVATTKAAALATAPATHPTAIRTRGLITSARLAIAVASVAATNPACTAIVSHAPWVGDSSKASASDGVTAVAENHSDMPSSSARASAPSMRHGRGRVVIGARGGYARRIGDAVIRSR